MDRPIGLSHLGLKMFHLTCTCTCRDSMGVRGNQVIVIVIALIQPKGVRNAPLPKNFQAFRVGLDPAQKLESYTVYISILRTFASTN